jgi:menaquinone-specific isochorismate synthase
LYEVNIRLNEKKLMQIAAASTRSRLTLPFITIVSISPIDIPAWLISRPESQKYYWSDRDGRVEIGGVGATMQFPRLDISPGNDDALEALNVCADDMTLFPSIRIFDPGRRPDPAWKSFASDHAGISQVMIVRKGSDYSFRHCVPVMPEPDVTAVKAGIERVSVPDGGDIVRPRLEFAARPIRVVSRPEADSWRANVDRVLHDIDAGQVKKVVLARRTDYEFEGNIEPWSLFLMLRNHNPAGYAIYHQPRPGVVFMSFTPERLYRRDGREIAVDALSSTVPRGATPEDDERLERQLRGDDKQNREHRFVVDDVTARLNPLCRERVRIGATSVMKLTRIQHLWTPVTGVLNDGIADDIVTEALHPTPAMGGTPRAEAMEMIRRLEPFDRGLYAAPWGYVGRAEAEYAVAIRSVLVVDNVVSVFAGAGIVAGSRPDQEWRELDSKDILRPLIAEGESL